MKQIICWWFIATAAYMLTITSLGGGNKHNTLTPIKSKPHKKYYLNKQEAELMQELGKVKKENRAIVLAIAFSESSLNYNVKHPDKDTCGIGGIKNKFYNIKNPNSLLGIEQVWVSLLDRYNGNFSKALKCYKGTVHNYKSYNITMRLYKRLKHKL